MNFSIRMFLQVLYLPSATAAKTEDLEEELLKSFFPALHFQSLGTMTQFLFKSPVGNKI